MKTKSYIFGTGKAVTEDPESDAVAVESAAWDSADAESAREGARFAMPDVTAMEADAPADETPAVDLDNADELFVVDDPNGYDPYDTQSLPALSSKDIFPASPGIGISHKAANDESDEPNPWETQVIPEDLCVTDIDEDGDPYNTTGRFKASNIWRKVLRK